MSNGETICSAGTDGKLRFLNKDADKPVEVLSGHGGSINAVALAPDGRWLLSGADDTTVLVWPLSAGAPKGPRGNNFTFSFVRL